MKLPTPLSRMTAALALITGLSAILLVAAPAAAKGKKAAPIDTSKLVWPGPPEIARIRYLGEYRGEDIRGIKKQSFLERLAGVTDATVKSMLIKPYGIAVDSKGRAFVTDTVVNAVFVFDFEKKTLEYRGDKPPVSFRKPMGVAVDDRDRLFVSDAEARNIVVFSPAGDAITTFGQGELTRPVGLAIDSALNRLYVADVKARKIAVYDLTSFQLQRWIGKSMDEKAEPGEQDKILSAPTNLAVDLDGLLYVVDSFLDRISVFDADGEPVRTFGSVGQGPGLFMRPRGIAFDCDGHVYVTDGMAQLFQILTAHGQPLMPVGSAGERPGQFQVPAAIAIDRYNRIFVADQNNRRIQVFRYITDTEADKAKAMQATAAGEGGKGK